MKFSLSASARLLLLQLLLVTFSLGLLYGIWDNRNFLTLFPFYILAALDVLWLLFFVHFAYRHRKALPTRKSVFLTLTVFWLYITIVNLGSTAYYAYQLGLTEAAAQQGQTPVAFVTSEIFYLTILPGIAVFLLLSLLRPQKNQTSYKESST